MKTKQRNFLAVCLLILSLGFAGCSSDSDGPIGPSVPDTGSLKVSFRASELATRALIKTAQSEEKELKHVDVFVYKADGTLEKVTRFAKADFNQNVDSYTLSDGKEISGLEVGAKKVALGINLPDTLVSKIQSAASAGMTSGHQMAVDHLTKANEYVMFGDIQTATVKANETSTISGIFFVDRIVAKVSVKKKPDLSMKVAGGLITKIEYNVQNINKVIYPLIPATFDKGTIDTSIPSFVKKVENMPEAGEDVEDEHDKLHTYMTEYTPVDTKSYPTYVRIHCAFSPEKYIIKADGTTESEYIEGDTFWTLPLTDGKVAYFVSKTVASDYYDAEKDNLIAEGDKKTFDELVTEYTDGNVDYGVFLHKTSNKFDVVRNNYYVITVTGINGLGEPGTTEQIDPKEKGGLVTFKLDINEWQGVDSNDEQIS